jgi:hypothetical protein
MASQKRSGTLVSWTLSKSGGFGKVLSDGEVFFTCKTFIAEGLPAVGCSADFVPRPAREGTQHRQAMDVSINNRSIVRNLALPPLIPKPATPDPTGEARKILSGELQP